jgi:hypothetical protein
MGELGFPIIEEKPDTGTVYFRSKTGDGHAVRIYLDTIAASIPSEGPVTRVGVRVGLTGDDVVSARVLDQISTRLKPPTSLPSTNAPILDAPRPIETKAPPLAPTSSSGRIVPVASTEKR